MRREAWEGYWHLHVLHQRMLVCGNHSSAGYFWLMHWGCRTSMRYKHDTVHANFLYVNSYSLLWQDSYFEVGCLNSNTKHLPPIRPDFAFFFFFLPHTHTAQVWTVWSPWPPCLLPASPSPPAPSETKGALGVLSHERLCLDLSLKPLPAAFVPQGENVCVRVAQDRQLISPLHISTRTSAHAVHTNSFLHVW